MVERTKSKGRLPRKLSRRDFLWASAALATGAILSACAPATPLVVEKEVIKEVPVEKAVVLKEEVIKEVPVEKVVEKEVVKEVPVEKIVQVEKEIVVTATPKPAVKKKVWVFECCWAEVHIKAGKQLYNDFRENHPDIEVTDFWPLPGDPGWVQELMAKVAAGEQIDVIWWCASHHKFAEEGRLLDLQPFVDADLDFSLDDFYAPSVDFCYDKSGRAGPLWAVPTNYATTLLYYNMNMLDNAGVDYPDKSWTYDDLLAAAKQLTKDTDGDGSPDEWGIQIGNYSGRWSGMLKAFGGDVVDVEAGKCLLAEPGSIAMFQWLQDLWYVHKVQPTPADIAGVGDRAMFMSDKLAMGFWPEWAQREFTDAHEELGLEWGVALLPVGPAGRYTFYWPGVTSIMSNAQSPEGAWEVAKFIVSDAYQRTMTVFIPESPSARKSTTEFRFLDYSTYPEDRSAFVESPNYGWLYYRIGRYGSELRDVIEPPLDPVWEGKVAPADVVGDICADVEERIAELKAGGV